MEGPKFYIPLIDNMGFMELPIAHLPDTENDMNDLLEVLRAEAAPLELWLALAKVYLSQVRRLICLENYEWVFTLISSFSVRRSVR